MINSGPSLLSELSSLQVRGQMCDTRLVGDNGSLMVHWTVLELRGVWWCQSRPKTQNIVLIPGVDVNELAEFVSRVYSQCELESSALLGRKKLTVSIEKLPLHYLNKMEFEEVKHEEPESLENYEEYDYENFDVKSEYSDQGEDEQYENKSLLLSSNFIHLLENGEFDRIVEEQYQLKRNSLPKYIEINKEVIREAVTNIKLEYLSQEASVDSKWLKYNLRCGLCDYKHKRKKCMIQHMTVHFKKMFHCNKCVKPLSHVHSHVNKIHSVKAGDSNQDYIPDTDEHEEYEAQSDDGSEYGNKSVLLASNFIQNLDNGEYDLIVDEQYQQKRDLYPKYIDINKNVIREAVTNIKLTFLSEEKSDKWVKYILSCGLCDYKHKLKKCVIQHMTVHFKKMHHCTKCDKAISHVPSHIKNIHSGRVEQVFTCDTCNKQFKLASQLARHKGSHDIVYCDQCDFSCEGREKLGRHRHHKHFPTSQCHICNKVFTSRDYLKTHLALHGNDVFNCDQCGKTYKSLTFLRSHINLVHRAKEINCEFCGQTFANNSEYKRHKIINHIKVKSHQCPLCDYKGYTKQYLQYHMEIHKEAKLSCSFCGKTFRQNGALKAHIMTHTGEKPYACSECSYRCIQPFELRKHFLKQHNKVIERPGLYLSPKKKE